MSQYRIVKEILDVAMNMGEPERTSYLIQNFDVHRKTKDGYTLFEPFARLVEDAFVAGRSQTTWEQFKKDNNIK